MKRKLMSLALALVLCLCLSTTAFAYETAQVGKPNVMSNDSWYIDDYVVVDENGILWMWSLYGTIDDYMAGTGDVNQPADVNKPYKVMDHVSSVSYMDGGTSVYPAIFVVKDDGSLWSWGNNTMGQLGNGGVYNETSGGHFLQTTPIKIMDGVVAVTCGHECAAAIKADGSLWMWGRNDDCQLGVGPGGNGEGTRGVGGYGVTVTSEYWDTPQKVMDDVKAVSCGWSHTAAVKTDGSLWTWGWNHHGVLGGSDIGNLHMDGYTVPHQSVPLKVMENVSTVSCDMDLTAVIKTDGTLWVWGQNWNGAVGNGYQGDEWYTSAERDGSLSRLPTQTTPVMVLTDVVDVFTNGAVTAAIREDGTLWMWGCRVHEALGPNIPGNGHRAGEENTLIQTVPAKFMDDDDVVDFYLGSTPMIIRSDGSVWAWGGQLHPVNPDLPWSVVPVQIPNLRVRVPGTTNTIQPEQSQGTTFSDVSAREYYADPVAWAVRQNITTGTGADKFSPGQTCTQAQILTFLYRAEQNITTPSAADMDKAVAWAKGKGMIDGSFNGSTPCTRATAVKYMWQAAGKPSAKPSSFTDVPADADYAAAVSWAVENDVTKGKGSTTTFAPDDTCTRGEIVTFLYRYFGK